MRHPAIAGQSSQEMATSGIACVEEMIAQHGVHESQALGLRRQMAARMIASGADRTLVEEWLDAKEVRPAVSRQAVKPGVNEAMSAPSPSANTPAVPNIGTLGADERAVMEMNANYINAKLTSQHEESKQEGIQ